MAYNI